MWRAFLDDLINNNEKTASSSTEKKTKSKLECDNHTLFKTKITKIDTLLNVTIIAENPIFVESDHLLTLLLVFLGL